MKRLSIILSAVLVLAATACTKQEMVKQLPAANEDGILFHAGFDTRVSTTEGVSTWQSGDDLSVFSRADAAAAGASVSANFKYVTTDNGASANFVPDADGVEAADKYFAFCPYTPTYASKLNADNDLGFDGAAAGAAVTDYRFVPINVNSGATFEFDPTTGESVSTNTKPSFYAVGDAPATPGDPIPLTFKPVLPLLELDLYGYGAFTQVEVMMTDKTTDVFTQDNWLTGKGVLDLSTGQFKVTNYSNTAYHKLTVTLKEADKDYIDLQGDKPMKVKLVTGHLNITKGLTLTFTKQGGGTITKTIWADKTVVSKNPQGVAKHIRQGVNVPYVTASAASVSEFAAAGGAADAITVSSNTSWSLQSKPDWISLDVTNGNGGESVVFTAAANDGSARNGSVVFKTAEGATCTVAVSQAAVQIAAADYYSVNIAGIDFADSYIYDIKDASDVLIARVTKEYLGVTVNKRVIAVYPTDATHKPVYTSGLVAQVDLDGGSAPAGNIHGGSVSAKTIDPSAVTYSAGTSAAITTVWVSADGSQILTSEPSGSISAASITPFVLTSPTDQSHSLVKLGNRIWTSEGYKTTKLASGTDLNVIAYNAGAQNTASVMVVQPGTVSSNPLLYLYNAYAVNSGLAPSGWALPSTTEWTTNLAGFLGGTSSYANMSVALIYDRNTWKMNGKSISALTYYNSWADSQISSSKWYMIMCQSGQAPTTNSTQAWTAMFEVRLMQVIE